MTLRNLKRSVAAAMVTVLVMAGISVLQNRPVWSAEAATIPVQASTGSTTTPLVTLPDMSAIVARNGAAVVNISMSGKSKGGDSGGLPGLDPNDPFYEFFRHFRIPQQRGERQVRGQGSGFIVREDGLVLTNAHVIDGADEVIVKLIDKREFKAKVLGADKATDVAVLRIDGKNLPTVKIGSSANARVGEWVLAIGSPFGFENSATAGIISAKSRSLPDDSYVPFIQTDVAVNPGNSGGPLFNMAGEVVGINSQIYSRTGGYQGLSFAIPIDVAMGVQEQIIKHGKVQRGRLGITIQEVNQSLADSFGLSKPGGALVSGVENGSPAAKAGVEPGDVILSLNGKEVVSSNELPPLVAAIRPGDTARLQVWRNKVIREIEVKVGGQKEEKSASAESKEPSSAGRLGLTVRSLSAEERRQFDVKGGLRVENASGAAARSGIRPGDVVLSVNGEAVSTPEQLRAVVGKAGKRVALLIQRDDARLFVPVDLN